MTLIISTPDTLHGAPRIAGTRIAVHQIVDLAAAGYSAVEIARVYGLSESDVASVLRSYTTTAAPIGVTQ